MLGFMFAGGLKPLPLTRIYKSIRNNITVHLSMHFYSDGLEASACSFQGLDVV